MKKSCFGCYEVTEKYFEMDNRSNMFQLENGGVVK